MENKDTNLKCPLCRNSEDYQICACGICDEGICPTCYTMGFNRDIITCDRCEAFMLFTCYKRRPSSICMKCRNQTESINTVKNFTELDYEYISRNVDLKYYKLIEEEKEKIYNTLKQALHSL